MDHMISKLRNCSFKKVKLQKYKTSMKIQNGKLTPNQMAKAKYQTQSHQMSKICRI